MIRLILFLIVIPFFAAYPFGDKKSITRMYMQGFALLVAIFSGMYIPAVIISAKLSDIRFSSFAGTFSVVVMVLSVYGALIMMRDIKGRSFSFTEIRAKAFNRFREGRPVKIICIIIGAIQVFRLIFLQPAKYLDEKTYISLINDIISTDILYGTYSDTGALYDGIASAIPKYLLAPWYPFLAYLSRLFGVHPLILCKTVIPIVMLILSYAALYCFGKLIIGEKDGESVRLSIYMLFVMALVELSMPNNDQSVAMLAYAMWGKNMSAAVAVPMIFVTFEEAVRKSEVPKAPLWLLVFSTAGCAGSASCMAVIPLEIGMLVISEVIVRLYKKRTISSDETSDVGILGIVCLALCGLIPPLIEGGLYVAMTYGGLLA